MRKLTPLVVASMLLSLNACSSYRGTDKLVISQGSTFALMPFDNQSNTPMAAQNVKNIVSSELVARNLKYVTFENTQEPEDLKSILDDNFEKRQAKEWLNTASYNYVLLGSVDEWNYKAGLDGEPVVSVTIEISDANGKVLYKKTGSRSGFGRESLNGAGQDVIEKILSDISYN
jgi:polysaccharide biosynthesis protein PelC